MGPIVHLHHEKPYALMNAASGQFLGYSPLGDTGTFCAPLTYMKLDAFIFVLRKSQHEPNTVSLSSSGPQEDLLQPDDPGTFIRRLTLRDGAHILDRQFVRLEDRSEDHDHPHYLQPSGHADPYGTDRVSYRRKEDGLSQLWCLISLADASNLQEGLSIIKDKGDRYVRDKQHADAFSSSIYYYY